MVEKIKQWGTSVHGISVQRFEIEAQKFEYVNENNICDLFHTILCFEFWSFFYTNSFFAKDYFCNIINLDNHDKYNRLSF
jgi:hypothetical protein